MSFREGLGKAARGLVGLLSLFALVGGGVGAYVARERNHAEIRRAEIGVRVRNRDYSYAGYLGSMCYRGALRGDWLSLTCVVPEDPRTREYGRTSSGATEVNYRDRQACVRGQWTVELVTPSEGTSVEPIQADGCTYGWAVRHQFPEIPLPTWIPIGAFRRFRSLVD